MAPVTWSRWWRPSVDPSPWPDTRRYRQPGPPAGPLPDWRPGDERPLVYVTFGSVTGHLQEAAGVYRAALDAVSGLPARVLLTVGRAFDADRLGPVPRTPAWSSGWPRPTCSRTPPSSSATAAPLRGLGPADVGPLRAAVERVLDEPSYRRAAERAARERAGMPALDDVVAQLTAGG